MIVTEVKREVADRARASASCTVDEARPTVYEAAQLVKGE